MLNLCQVIGPLCFLVVEILVFINKFAPLCSLWSLVFEIEPAVVAGALTKFEIFIYFRIPVGTYAFYEGEFLVQ